MRTAVSRTDVFHFVSRVLGAEWNDVQKVVIDPHGITVTSLRRDETGGPFTEDGETAATEEAGIAMVGDVDSSTVRMRHPDLPDQPVTAPASAAGHMAMSGWVPVDEPDGQGGAVPYDQGGEPASGVTEATNDSGEAEPVIAETPRRRRTQKEGES